MKLHLCCGDVYLKDYINIDIDGKHVFDCTTEEIACNATTLDQYFKYSFGSPRRPILVDCKMNLLQKWPYANAVADKIVMISAFEHFYPQDAKHIVNEISRVLKPGGIFIVDFPDIKKDVELYYEKDPEFLMELIYCNHKNQHSVHHWGYTPDTFRKLWGKGFWIPEITVVPHAYPMTGMIVVKLPR